jgi:enoyl-CoA hydratase/carnithine racemase
VLTAKNILAEEAAEIGLVNKVVPGDELIATAREMALQIASHEPEVVRFAKRVLYEGAGLGMADAMLNEQGRSEELRKARGK